MPQESSSRWGLLLIAGNQTHQENYARAFAADPRCRLIGLTDEVGVSSRRERLNRELAAELNVPYFEQFEAALHREDVDVVSICADPERRGRITVLAARAGKHLYLDKEPAVTRNDLQEVERAIRDAGVRSQTFSLVRSALAQRARRALQSGRLGTLRSLHCEMYFAKGFSGTADVSLPRKEKCETPQFTFLDSKRELLCVGWYPLILFQWLTGARITRVGAVTSNFFFGNHQHNDVEDHAQLILDMEGGIQATITVGRTGWKSHPSHGVHQLQLVGTGGCEFLDAYRPRLELFSQSDWTLPEAPHPEDPMGFWTSTQKAGKIGPKFTWSPLEEATRSDASAFLDCLEEGRESDVPAAMGVRTVEVVLAAYRAAAEEQFVTI